MLECLSNNPLFEGVGIWLLLMGLLAFFTMGIDKARAGWNEWRVKESTLFLMASVGGFWGIALGMHLFHHKTSKPIFLLVTYTISALWLVLISRLGLAGCLISGITHL